MQQYRHRCAVLGKPIAHSLSPVLHMAAYRRLALSDWQYLRHEVDAAGLEELLSSLDPSWAGLSLTMPLKRTVMPLGTPSDTWSSALQVANTAVLDWTDASNAPAIALYNTDVQGISKALGTELVRLNADAAGSSTPTLSKSAGHVQVHTAMILGSGNTASSALAACSELGAEHVVVCARHPERAAHLSMLAERLGIGMQVRTLSQALSAVDGQDVIISTLPAHAADGIADELSNQAWHGDLGLLLDVVYDPRPSRLMTAWRDKGARAIGGEMMLLYQAIPQVALMTGIDEHSMPSDIDMAMLQALQEVL
ncbi:shikimate dehydrogenase [Bifidobacterium crudilactis]|uniref:shikimate dehydrogenase n=1 Tax=Bifidobacterium crudilactis TaxID=327277 RepID=UPI002353627A|nr:shikimate dehydrogenase [Bifidobacterium crudilactis]